MEFGVDFDQTATKSSCDVKWHGISMKIHATFFAGHISNIYVMYLHESRWTWRLKKKKKKKEKGLFPVRSLSKIFSLNSSNYANYIWVNVRENVQRKRREFPLWILICAGIYIYIVHIPFSFLFPFLQNERKWGRKGKRKNSSLFAFSQTINSLNT